MSDAATLDFPLFHRLLQNLLKMNVLEYRGEEEILRHFEEKYYLYPPFQPMFSAESLQYLFRNMHDNTIYEISDELGICLTFFHFADRIYLVGPYVKNYFNDSAVQKLLLRHKLPASTILSLKMHYAQLPQINDFYIEESIKICISSFQPETSAIYFKQLQGLREDFSASVPAERSEQLLTAIYRRYASEQEFMNQIRMGDVRSITGTLSRMFHDSFSNDISAAIFTPVYQNPLSIIRILARKAAEESGLSVITIDYITQKNVQKMAGARTLNDSRRYISEVVTELTQAVHDHLYRTETYSPLIHKAMEYLDMNYAENVTGPELCQYLGVSVSYLSKTFKAETGMTVTQALAQIRCRHAAELLVHSDLSIQEISSYVGYLDNNYFIKVFKKQYGMTPSEYQSSKKDS